MTVIRERHGGGGVIALSHVSSLRERECSL